MTYRTNTVAKLLLCAPIGAAVMFAAGTAEAATPTYYADLATFQGDITTSVTDDYSNAGYMFIQNNAVMSGVVGETDYMSTGFNDLNIVSNEQYCAGCNGSFELSFLTTSVGTAAGVVGVGMNIPGHSQATPYFAFITFADGTTEDIQMPAQGSFWGVAAPERIERIHFGLSMGATTTSGSFSIDDLIVGDGIIPDSDCCTASPTGTPGCTDAACEALVCANDAFCCNNSWDGICANGAIAACPVLCGVVCGDGVVEGAEQCDDAGESANCNADCTFATCGDQIVNAAAGEDCDDGGESAACDANCTFATCGDGEINMAAGETCDDGGESATCNADCTPGSCGDGQTNVAAGEECDDAGESATCDVDCTPAMCGDSTVNATAGENCDDGGRSATCNANCTSVSCGDGVLNMTAGEQCDDGGESATCDDDCTAAMCGDLAINAAAGEDCDDGGESATCDDDCTAATCGDGTTNATAGEECDDGNTDDGDGCAADCVTEMDPGSTGDPGDTGDTDDSGDTGVVDDTGMGDTAGVDTASVDTGNIDTGVASDDSGTGADGGVIPPPDFSSCNCTTTPPRQGRLWWLMAALGLFVRRRRNA